MHGPAGSTRDDGVVEDGVRLLDFLEKAFLGPEGGIVQVHFLSHRDRFATGDPCVNHFGPRDRLGEGSLRGWRSEEGEDGGSSVGDVFVRRTVAETYSEVA